VSLKTLIEWNFKCFRLLLSNHLQIFQDISSRAVAQRYAEFTLNIHHAFHVRAQHFSALAERFAASLIKPRHAQFSFSSFHFCHKKNAAQRCRDKF